MACSLFHDTKIMNLINHNQQDGKIIAVKQMLLAK